MESIWKEIDGTWFQPMDIFCIHKPNYNRYDEEWSIRVQTNTEHAQSGISFEAKTEDEIKAIHAELVALVVK